MALTVVVSYYPDAVAFADARAESFIRNAVKTYTDIGHTVLNIASSTINVIEVARCLRKEGVIEQLYIDWHGRSYPVNADGRWEVPAGFPDYVSIWAERLLTRPAPLPNLEHLQEVWTKVPETSRGAFLVFAKFVTQTEAPTREPKLSSYSLRPLIELGLLTAFPVSSDPDDTRMNLGLSELGEQLYNLRILITPLKES